IANIASVNIVINPDKSKWSRCPVIELADNEDDGTAPLSEGNAKKFNLRKGQSVGKDGKPDGTGTGMGWFPGYAINVETGERLNIMFGEDSWYMSYNGRDMIWNPTTIYSNVQGEPIMGGKHFIYVMGHNGDDDKNCPAYDGGTWCYNTLLSGEKFDYIKRYVYNNVMWVSVPMLTYGEKLLSNEVTIKIRVAKPYEKNYSTYGSSTPQNDDYPMYKFNTSDIKTILEDYASKKDAMDNIKVVPNPYYAYSAYETSQIDNRVRITNLPPRCDISIYSLNGVLIRKLSKDDQVTYLDWDLKNSAGIPISSGIYLFHIYSNPNSNPNSGAKKGDGHKIIKWFATMRPIDLNAY
ncbi:MAG: T9SS C-terminal target domain-containing protein, partial [Bacteroidota bacterium]|nr:T9SS C-terminal target domain-containing protein [Bacteroidota bacterium]